ncbi:hypothetical protein LEP3755_18880 [Leptolyngbya sp. NIES-3755]|nr:hypothetical protein LEP3755_18880 [Leptolyngbya sp. NIES-3755]
MIARNPAIANHKRIIFASSDRPAVITHQRKAAVAEIAAVQHEMGGRLESNHRLNKERTHSLLMMQRLSAKCFSSSAWNIRRKRIIFDCNLRSLLEANLRNDPAVSAIMPESLRSRISCQPESYSALHPQRQPSRRFSLVARMYRRSVGWRLVKLPRKCHLECTFA